MIGSTSAYRATGLGEDGKPARAPLPGLPFGRALRARRREVGLTQVGLAELAGMSQGALSRLESGRGVPTVPVLQRLARAMESELLIAVSPHGGLRVVFRVFAGTMRGR